MNVKTELPANSALTNEQRTALREHIKNWQKIGLTLKPANRELVNQKMGELYAIADHKPPQKIVWLPDMLSASICAAVHTSDSKYLMKNIQNGYFEKVNTVAHDAMLKKYVDNKICYDTLDEIRGHASMEIHEILYNRAATVATYTSGVLGRYVQQNGNYVNLDTAFENTEFPKVRDAVLSVLDDLGYKRKIRLAKNKFIPIDFMQSGRLIGTAATAQFLSTIVDVELNHALADITSSCYGWWPFEDVCFVCENPAEVYFDDEKRLHCETSASIYFPESDWKAYHFHGIEVPAAWVENKENVDPAEILAVENVELKAAGVALLGMPRLIHKLDRKIIDGDPDSDIGALVEFTLPGLPQAGRFLQAICPRNGTIIEGVPRVSDIDGLPIETAIAAQAWRDGLPVSEYAHPLYRT